MEPSLSDFERFVIEKREETLDDKWKEYEKGPGRLQTPYDWILGLIAECRRKQGGRR